MSLVIRMLFGVMLLFWLTCTKGYHYKEVSITLGNYLDYGETVELLYFYNVKKSFGLYSDDSLKVRIVPDTSQGIWKVSSNMSKKIVYSAEGKLSYHWVIDSTTKRCLLDTGNCDEGYLRLSEGMDEILQLVDAKDSAGLLLNTFT